MKSPDKIHVYLSPQGIIESVCILPYKDGSTEFINKKTLLEYAEKKQEQSLGASTQAYFQMFIDKLNSI